MKYDERMGMVYDTIYFGVLLFNYDRIISYLQKQFGIIKEDLKYFERLKNVVPAPPSELYPLFYYNLSDPSYLTNYMFNNFEYGKENFNDFLFKMEHDSDMLSDIICYYFNGKYDFAVINDLNGYELTREIINLPYEQDLIVSLLHIVTEFADVMNSLLSYLDVVYSSLKELYILAKPNIDNMLSLYTDERYLRQYHANETIILYENADSAFSLSLLNIVLIFQKGNKYIFGICSYDYLESNIQIEPTDFFETLGNPVKSQIIHFLCEDEFTATQLADKMFVSRQTITRHLFWLANSRFIQVSKKSGPEVYYFINPNFFKTAKFISMKHIENLEKIYLNFKKGEITNGKKSVEKTNNL